MSDNKPRAGRSALNPIQQDLASPVHAFGQIDGQAI